MSQESISAEMIGRNDAHFTIDSDRGQLTAWSEIEPGRFMPRRVRGSFQGRALG
jgi:hypothetical protein